MNKLKLISILLGPLVVGNAQAYTPKNMDVFNNVINAMSEEDIKGFLSNMDSGIGRSVTKVNASKLISVYKNNEMAGDKQFKGKPIRINTVASAIKTDFSGDAYIVANGRNNYESVMLKIDKDDERNLKINKGNKIDFVCYGGGMVINTPVLNSCMYPKDFAVMVYDNIKKDIQRISNKNYKPLSIMEGQIAYVAILLENKTQESCVTAGVKCASEVSKASSFLDNAKKEDFSDEQLGEVKRIVEYLETEKNLPYAPVKPKESTRLKKLLG
ncbi:hypothetical protein R8O69_003296 [Klebsiella oxytoca]|nr:hypothetical protein [Klebsiella oxytoca]ELT9977607.1 hypothetical protein [Klebsiella oxytoca]